MRMILSLLLKIPVVIVATVIGIFGASQLGWSGAELLINSILMGFLEQWVTMIMFAIGGSSTMASIFLVCKVLKPALCVTIPVLLYIVLIPGVWNGVLSDFDATRAAVLKEGLRMPMRLNT